MLGHRLLNHGPEGEPLNRPRLNIRRSEPSETNTEPRPIAAAAAHPTCGKHGSPLYPRGPPGPGARAPLRGRPQVPTRPAATPAALAFLGTRTVPSPRAFPLLLLPRDAWLCRLSVRLLSGVLSPGALLFPSGPSVPLSSLLCFVRNPLSDLAFHFSPSRM